MYQEHFKLREAPFSVGLGGALEGQNLQKEAVECYQRALKTETLREDLLA
jgi:hypothetical protein